MEVNLFFHVLNKLIIVILYYYNDIMLLLYYYNRYAYLSDFNNYLI